MADRLAHFPHLPIAPFADGDEQQAGADQLDIRELRAAAVDRHAAFESIEIVGVGDAEHSRLVHARHAVARVREPRREIAVVGQEQQALGIEVQPPDGIDVLLDAAQQVDHRWSPLRIRPRCHVAARLVQQDVAVVLGQFDASAVDPDVVLCRIGLRAELGGRCAVHRDAAVEHQLLGRAPRRDTGLGQDFLESFHLSPYGDHEDTKITKDTKSQV